MANFVGALFNPMLDEAGTIATTASLHTALPSAGSNEVSGGAYARQSVTWSAAAGSSLVAAGAVVFSVPGSTSVTHLGLWGSGNTWLGSIELNNPEEFASAGTLTIDPLSLSLINVN